MKTIKKKILITVLIAIVLIVTIGGAAFAYVYFATDVFRTPQQLFSKYLLQNLQEVEQIVNLEKLGEIEEKLKQNKYEENTTISYDELGMQLTIDTQNDPINKKMYKNFSILTEGLEDSLEIEYMLENGTHSIRFTEVVKQFLSVENRDLKQLATNLGIEEEVVELIPDTINFEEFSLERLQFTEEEKNTEINKYANIVYTNIPTEKYIKNKDSVITLDGKTVTTNAYVLTINEQDLKNIVIKLLETLKQDEIILEKIQIIDEMTYEYRDEELKQVNFKDVFVELIQEVLDEINLENTQDLNENQETAEIQDIIISVYEEKGNTVRIKIEQGLASATIDTTHPENQNKIDINYTIIDTYNTQASIKVIIQRETENKLNLNITTIYGEEQATSQLSVELKESDNNTQVELISDSQEGKITFNRNINFVEEINYKVVLDSSNNKILNDMSSDQITNIFSAIGKRITSEYIEPLTPILVLLMFSEGQDSILNSNLTQTEMSVFNSKFTVYEGENVSALDVNSLLNTILTHNIEEANNLTERYVTVSGDVILEDDATSITTVNGENGYKVECQFGTNGLVNEIVITEKTTDDTSEFLENDEDTNSNSNNVITNENNRNDNLLDSLNSAN